MDDFSHGDRRNKKDTMNNETKKKDCPEGGEAKKESSPGALRNMKVVF